MHVKMYNPFNNERKVYLTTGKFKLGKISSSVNTELHIDIGKFSLS